MSKIWSFVEYAKIGPGQYAAGGIMVSNDHSFGPIASRASWTCPASVDSGGISYDFSGATRGWFNNWLWLAAGGPSDSPADFVPFFQTEVGNYPADGQGLSPAILGTYEDGGDTFPCVAIARANWLEISGYYRPGWSVPPNIFFPQKRNGDVVHPVTGDVLGTGHWYHRP